MHRATPLMTSFRAFTAGGARSVVKSVDDSKLMQEMGGGLMAGEKRSMIEAPQNYGFTSVTMDADQAQSGGGSGGGSGGNGGGGGGFVGAIKQMSGMGPECFVSFMGGNRSFPACGPIDDRRHRLFNLAKGDVAMFRTKNDKQQFHLTGDGGFWTATRDKTVRMQLLDEDSQQQQSGQGGQGGQGGSGGGQGRDILHVGTRDGSAGGSGSGGQSSTGSTSQMGQSSVYKNGQSSYRFVHVTKDATEASGTNVKLRLQDNNAYVHVADDKKVYLGAEKGKGKFDIVVTLSGPTKNVQGLLGGGS
jgi:phage gp45-like